MLSRCFVPETTQSASPDTELSLCITSDFLLGNILSSLKILLLTSYFKFQTEITALKRTAEYFLKEKTEIRDEYLVTVFLCPNIRNLKNLKEEE